MHSTCSRELSRVGAVRLVAKPRAVAKDAREFESLDFWTTAEDHVGISMTDGVQLGACYVELTPVQARELGEALLGFLVDENLVEPAELEAIDWTGAELP
jgi:hypothetical protein